LAPTTESYRNPKPKGLSFELNASVNISHPTPLVLSEGVSFCLTRQFFVTQLGLTGCETVEDTPAFEIPVLSACRSFQPPHKVKSRPCLP
jgi:hypothetical protein